MLAYDCNSPVGLKIRKIELQNKFHGSANVQHPNILLQAYRFVSNEYRLFPIRFIFDVCDSLIKNELGIQNIYNCGNFTRCPIKKVIN
ncbi:hypothetical protein ILUMI_12718 [Ignelater luminosus]|uniref:Uncharacterized protein n=1 Tax=Ignelater luminosus TaxID=2038154 RepID=A0A8K0GCN9_IGNLU|nr:hypothetical protein ILUMI_12718 [Ignelater luminosus]